MLLETFRGHQCCLEVGNSACFIDLATGFLIVDVNLRNRRADMTTRSFKIVLFTSQAGEAREIPTMHPPSVYRINLSQNPVNLRNRRADITTRSFKIVLFTSQAGEAPEIPTMHPPSVYSIDHFAVENTRISAIESQGFFSNNRHNSQLSEPSELIRDDFVNAHATTDLHQTKSASVFDRFKTTHSSCSDFLKNRLP